MQLKQQTFSKVLPVNMTACCSPHRRCSTCEPVPCCSNNCKTSRADCCPRIISLHQKYSEQQDKAFVLCCFNGKYGHDTKPHSTMVALLSTAVPVSQMDGVAVFFFQITDWSVVLFCFPALPWHYSSSGQFTICKMLQYNCNTMASSHRRTFGLLFLAPDEKNWNKPVASNRPLMLNTALNNCIRCAMDLPSAGSTTAVQDHHTPTTTLY